MSILPTLAQTAFLVAQEQPLYPYMGYTSPYSLVLLGFFLILARRTFS